MIKKYTNYEFPCLNKILKIKLFLFLLLPIFSQGQELHPIITPDYPTGLEVRRGVNMDSEYIAGARNKNTKSITIDLNEFKDNPEKGYARIVIKIADEVNGKITFDNIKGSIVGRGLKLENQSKKSNNKHIIFDFPFDPETIKELPEKSKGKVTVSFIIREGVKVYNSKGNEGASNPYEISLGYTFRNIAALNDWEPKKKPTTTATAKPNTKPNKPVATQKYSDEQAWQTAESEAKKTNKKDDPYFKYLEAGHTKYKNTANNRIKIYYEKEWKNSYNSVDKLKAFKRDHLNTRRGPKGYGDKNINNRICKLNSKDGLCGKIITPPKNAFDIGREYKKAVRADSEKSYMNFRLKCEKYLPKSYSGEREYISADKKREEIKKYDLAALALLKENFNSKEPTSDKSCSALNQYFSASPNQYYTRGRSYKNFLSNCTNLWFVGLERMEGVDGRMKLIIQNPRSYIESDFTLAFRLSGETVPQENHHLKFLGKQDDNSLRWEINGVEGGLNAVEVLYNKETKSADVQMPERKPELEVIPKNDKTYSIRIIGGEPPFSIECQSERGQREFIKLDEYYHKNQRVYSSRNNQFLKLFTKGEKYNLRVKDIYHNTIGTYEIEAPKYPWYKNTWLWSFILLIGLFVFILYNKRDDVRSRLDDVPWFAAMFGRSRRRKKESSIYEDSMDKVFSKEDTISLATTINNIPPIPQRDSAIKIKRRRIKSNTKEKKKEAKKVKRKEIEEEIIEPFLVKDIPIPTKDHISLDINEMWENTLVKEIHLSISFAKEISKLNHYFCDNNKVNAGGFILGKKISHKKEMVYSLFFEKFIPISPKITDVYEISLDKNCYKELNSALETWEDYELLGWFHYHLGHGCFLSRPDLGIHLAHFNKPYQVAMEMDVLSEKMDTVIFTWKKSRMMIEDLDNYSELESSMNTSGEYSDFSWLDIDAQVRKELIGK